MRVLFIVLAVLRIAVSLSGSETQAQFKCELTDDPAEVNLFYGDIQNFVRAFRILKSAEDAEDVLRKEYIEKASLGLKEYLRETGFEAKDYLEAIKNKPAQFAALKELQAQLVSEESRIREALSELRKIIPNALYMPGYYFVGLSESGFNAQPSEYGLIIAISELAKKPDR